MKKIFVSLLSLLLILSIAGCDKIKIRPEKPQLAELNGKTALKYVKGLYSDARITRWMGPVENLINLKAAIKYDVNVFKLFIDVDEFEKEEKNKCGFSVETFQERIDEIFGKDRFKVQDHFQEYLDDGYVMVESNPDAFEFPEIVATGYSVYEEKEHYVVIERLSEFYTPYKGETYTTYLRDLIVVYSTYEGLKVWDCQSGFADTELTLYYFPPLPYEEEPFESDIWKQMTFTLDGETFKYPWDLRQFEALGWIPQIDDHFTMDPNPNSFYVVFMERDIDAGYVENNFLKVQLINYSDKVRPVRDNAVVYVNFQIITNKATLEVMKEPYKLVLANGITWGATEEDIINAYGEGEIMDGFGYTIITYDVIEAGYRISMKLTVRENIGLCDVELMKYVW